MCTHFEYGNYEKSLKCVLTLSTDLHNYEKSLDCYLL